MLAKRSTQTLPPSATLAWVFFTARFCALPSLEVENLRKMLPGVNVSFGANGGESEDDTISTQKAGMPVPAGVDMSQRSVPMHGRVQAQFVAGVANAPSGMHAVAGGSWMPNRAELCSVIWFLRSSPHS